LTSCPSFTHGIWVLRFGLSDLVDLLLADLLCSCWLIWSLRELGSIDDGEKGLPFASLFLAKGVSTSDGIHRLRMDFG
jgi:hypothetical protein